VTASRSGAGPNGASTGTAGSRPPVATVDLDGVVADTRHRLHHLNSRPKNWDAFFAGAIRDDVLPEGLGVVRTLADKAEIVYLTGRPERCRADTEAWLRDHELPPGRVLMRRAGDRRPAAVVKAGIWARLSRSHRIVMAVDDDPTVIDVARKAGIPVLLADWMPEDAADTLHEAQNEGKT
jgi:hypothetical protein